MSNTISQSTIDKAKEAIEKMIFHALGAKNREHVAEYRPDKSINEGGGMTIEVGAVIHDHATKQGKYTNHEIHVHTYPAPCPEDLVKSLKPEDKIEIVGGKKITLSNDLLLEEARESVADMVNAQIAFDSEQKTAIASKYVTTHEIEAQCADNYSQSATMIPLKRSSNHK